MPTSFHTGLSTLNVLFSDSGSHEGEVKLCCSVNVCILYKQAYEKCTDVCLCNSKAQLFISHGEKIETYKTFKHGNVHLT